MPSPRFHLSPHCVVVPGSDEGAVTLVHSVYGSRFILDAAFVAALLGGHDGTQTRPPGMSAGTWASAIAELRKEQVLLDHRSYKRLMRSHPFKNRLDPIAATVLRGVNEGGTKATVEGPPPLAAKPGVSRRNVELSTHLPEGALADLASSLSARRSIRTYSKKPLALWQLERFLLLTARAYARIEHPVLGTTSLRNYPGGGARYPLEIYPVVLNVRSLARGFYYYHPFHHRLESLGRMSRYLDALRQTTRARMGRPAGDPNEPAVLFIITAVFPRICWKYEKTSLHLILQETGALYQTMYLTATSMGLAPCAVGAFPERAIGEILGLDSADESQVGLFALGVPAEAQNHGEPIVIEHFSVRRGSPFSPDPSRHSVELVFGGGLKEIIDACDVSLTRAGTTFACSVMRGRQRAVFKGRALSSLRRLISERNGVMRCRLGRSYVTVGADG